MKIRKKNSERNRIRNCFDGFVNLLAATNFYSGERSLGDKFLDWNWRCYTGGLVKHPLFYASGYFAATGLEFGIFAASVYYAVKGQPEYFLANVSLKVVPRSLDIVVRNKLRPLGDEKHKVETIIQTKKFS